MFFIRSERIDLVALTGILNSKLVEFWLESKGKKQGNLFKLDKGPLTTIPIPFCIPVEHENNLHDLVLDVQQKRINNIDTSYVERSIDFIVYHLYNLTYDEVLVIDPETPITREKYDNYE